LLAGILLTKTIGAKLDPCYLISKVACGIEQLCEDHGVKAVRELTGAVVM
jgi:hypothetical protein